jgi:hypothetical protein
MAVTGVTGTGTGTGTGTTGTGTGTGPVPVPIPAPVTVMQVTHRRNSIRDSRVASWRAGRAGPRCLPASAPSRPLHSGLSPRPRPLLCTGCRAGRARLHGRLRRSRSRSRGCPEGSARLARGVDSCARLVCNVAGSGVPWAWPVLTVSVTRRLLSMKRSRLPFRVAVARRQFYVGI